MVRTAHTAQLDNATLRAARALLEVAFDGELTAEDWEHCLGGIHALAWDGDELVGHAAVVQRRLVHDGTPLRVGYVEGVAVRADQRRRGLAGALMGELEEIIRRAYDCGALGSSDDGLPFYTGRGWKPWRGTLRTLTLDGIEDTPDERGWILVFGGQLDLDGDLLCADVRPGDLW
jgi:aminoglycoside 2'-N-acetyltransferase I